MDISTLKEALGDEKFAALQGYVEDLIGQRDTARNESITGRKGLRAKLDKLEADQASLLAKLGLDSLDEIETLPDAKGAAEAAKQYEAKLKRAERQVAELSQERDDALGKFRNTLQRAATAEAMNGHKFVARDLVENFVSSRLTWEGDDLLYKSEDGKLIPVKDAVASIAKTRPELLEPTGTGGAGVRQSNAGSGGGPNKMTRAEFDSLPPLERTAAAKSGVQLT